MVVLHYIAFIVIVEIKSFIKSLIAVWKVVAVVALLLVAVNILSVHLIASPLLDVSGECNVQWPPPTPMVDQCSTPKNNIVFLKVHKAASSTVQNILMRYGAERNLKFVLPKRGNYFKYLKPFQASQVYWPRRADQPRENNILTHHTQFNFERIKALMPDNSNFVAIVRDPVRQFQSIYNYYNLTKTYDVEFEEFINHANHYYYETRDKRFARNPMMFDFGVMQEDLNNCSVNCNKLKSIASQFDLIMISERMDESLILLKQLMCWSFEDIVALQANTRVAASKERVTELDAKIKHWNWADTLLYDLAMKQFEMRIDVYGRQKMQTDVTTLQQVRQRVIEGCGIQRVKRLGFKGRESAPLFKPWHPQVNGFEPAKDKLTDATCVYLTAAEIPLTVKLRKLQLCGNSCDWSRIFNLAPHSDTEEH